MNVECTSLTFLLLLLCKIDPSVQKANLFLHAEYMENRNGKDLKGKTCLNNDCAINIDICALVWNNSHSSVIRTDICVKPNAMMFNIQAQEHIKKREHYWYAKFGDILTDNKNDQLTNPIRERIPNLESLWDIQEKGVLHIKFTIYHIYKQTDDDGTTILVQNLVDIVNSSVPMANLLPGAPPVRMVEYGYSITTNVQGATGKKTMFKYSVYLKCAANYYGCDCEKRCLPSYPSKGRSTNDIIHLSNRHHHCRQCDQDGNYICTKDYYPKEREVQAFEFEDHPMKQCSVKCITRNAGDKDGQFCDFLGKNRCLPGYCRQLLVKSPVEGNPCIKRECHTTCYMCKDEDCTALKQAPKHDPTHCTCIESDTVHDDAFYTCEQPAE